MPKQDKKPTNKTSVVLLIVIVPLIAILATLGWLTSRNNNTETTTFHIAPYRADCVGIAPMECLVVNDELFYSTIEGFTFEEGTEYEVVVEIKELDPEEVPADASSYEYKLIEIISATKQTPPDTSPRQENENPEHQTNQPTPQNPAEAPPPPPATPNTPAPQQPTAEDPEEPTSEPQSLEGTSWLWEQIIAGPRPDEVAKPEDPQEFKINFYKNTFDSTTDCNNIAGNYSTDGDTVNITAWTTTNLVCIGTAWGGLYTNVLSLSEVYEIKDEKLIITSRRRNSDGSIFDETKIIFNKATP